MLAKFALAALVVAAFTSGVAADKIVTYSTVALTDVTAVCFERNADAATGWRSRASAVVRGTGTTSYTAQVAGPVTAGQKTTIETYITNNVLTPLNTQEGL